MVQLFLDVGFPLHSLVKLRLVVLVLVLVDHYLEGNIAVGLNVIAFVDLSEAASSQQLEGLVAVVDEWPTLLVVYRPHFLINDLHSVLVNC